MSDDRNRTIRLTIDVIYNAEQMHYDDPEGIQWFNEDVLGGALQLWSDEIGDSIGDVRVIGEVTEAEFPVALASLLPEGCTRFECGNKAGTTVHYARLANYAWWTVSDDPMQEIWRLEDIAEQFDLDVRTVVPLQVHPQYVEERR